MYVLQADETNSEPNQGSFFIYGGVACPGERLGDLHREVQAARDKFGFQPKDQLKFNTHTRPAAMSFDDWTAAKGAVLDAAVRLDLDLLIYVVHHRVAAGVQVDQRNEYALNSLIAHFDMRYLAEKNDLGMVTVDRLDEKFGYGYLRSRFQQPLDLPDGRTPPLGRVLHYSMTCDGASHMSSVVDLAIGAMRYCVNTATGTGKPEVAEQLFPVLSKLMWSGVVAGRRHLGGYGFLAYPKAIRSPALAQEYDALRERLTSYANAA